MSLTYTYIGNRDGKFFITASGAIYQYATTVPFSGEILPELIVPADYASLALRLFPTEDVQMGVTDKQHLVMYVDSTLISTRTSLSEASIAVIRSSSITDSILPN